MGRKVVFIFIAFHFFGFAQKNELGKVTIEELKEKVCPIDTAAAAAIIFKTSKIKYDVTIGQVVTETEVKLKIYKKEGYEYANIDEAYYIGNGERVDFSNVATYNIVKGEIVKTKLKKEGEFKEEVTKDIYRKKITLSDVKEGSIIEYKIKKFTNNGFRLVNFFFQEEIPVRDVELKVEYPAKFYYSKTLTGYSTPEVVEEGFNDAASGLYTNRCIYRFHDILPLKEEGFVNNINNYRTRIRYELASVKNSYGVEENISRDWESVVKKVYESEYFGAELKKTGYFENDIDAILKDLKTNQEKMDAIFNFVKSKVIWNEELGFTCDDGVKKAYQQKKGNVAEINLMLTAMLRYAGIEANPILVSTRSNGVFMYPSVAAYNYVIAGVELENQVVLLDATNKYSLPNILPIRDLNWYGRIIRKNESSAEIDLMPKSNSKDVINILATVNDNGEISGKIREQYFDYNAFIYRNKYSDDSNDAYIEKLEKRYQGLEISDYEVQNKNDITKPVIENYSFTSSNSVEIIGDKMYVSPFLFFATSENPFKQEKREYPIDFVFPSQDKFNISINLPEGYVVENLPQPKAVAMPDNMGTIKYNISNNGSQVQLLYVYEMNQPIIPSEYYEILKNFYKEIVNKQTEKIVIKKG
jgi:hypothetical protein